MGIFLAVIGAIIFSLLFFTWAFLERHRKEYVFRHIFFHGCVFITYSLFYYLFREGLENYYGFLAYAGLLMFQEGAFAWVMLYDLYGKISFKKLWS